jgi:hypothetical protein
MDFDPQEGRLRMSRRRFGQRPAIAKTYLEYKRCIGADIFSPTQDGRIVGNTINRKQCFQRVPLSAGETAFPSHEASDRPGVCGVGHFANLGMN